MERSKEYLVFLSNIHICIYIYIYIYIYERREQKLNKHLTCDKQFMATYLGQIFRVYHNSSLKNLAVCDKSSMHPSHRLYNR